MKHWLVSVDVILHPAILDPQGKATLSGLKNLGFDSIVSVRIGKRIDLQVIAESIEEAKQIGQEAATKLLANPVMETFEIVIKELEYVEPKLT
ncbi:MAG: phosphoribosylformylglycinamidine synthase subunit PurS [Bacteroidia bacterium]|nr:phosphoribosylformylglycinamidine synthase subunit PurS [Bacteroidia bacterium]